MKTKTPLEITQELIAVHTSRLELVEKLMGKGVALEGPERFTSATRQSEKFTKELMIELSNFGDAAMSSVDNQNEYQAGYKDILGKIDAMSPEDGEQAFQKLETSLRNIYQAFLKTSTALPTSLQEILSSQDTEIRRLV